MKDNACLISLIICTYRRPKPVSDLLCAIAEQSYAPDEVLIVDGSPDTKTKEIVKIFEKGNKIKNLKYFDIEEKHRGLTSQRNLGVMHSKGEIVAFLDDDTIPERNYLEEISLCFARHPEAIGVGGYITTEVIWKPADKQDKCLSKFRFDGWQRRESYRWRLRKILGLDSNLPPGWMPEWGHGRPVGFLPPSGKDYSVEFIMGGVSAWRRKIFDNVKFSSYFEGYGLYEDTGFCLEAHKIGEIYFSTKAKIAHIHAMSGRPKSFQYGKMVVRNGWFVWRKRWPSPSFMARFKWCAITILLAFCGPSEFRNSFNLKALFLESLGRFSGIISLVYNRPEDREEE